MVTFMKIVRAGLVVAAVLCVAATSNAQAPRNGKFTLTDPVQWGKMVLPPGHYSLDLEQLMARRVVFVREGSRGIGFALASEATSNCQKCQKGVLLIHRQNGTAYVQSLHLLGYRATFIVPPSKRAAEEEIAKGDSFERIPISAD
jgi:hypothetical protein